MYKLDQNRDEWASDDPSIMGIERNKRKNNRMHLELIIVISMLRCLHTLEGLIDDQN